MDRILDAMNEDLNDMITTYGFEDIRTIRQAEAIADFENEWNRAANIDEYDESIINLAI